jgi:hypothetical protein
LLVPCADNFQVRLLPVERIEQAIELCPRESEYSVDPVSKQRRCDRISSGYFARLHRFLIIASMFRRLLPQAGTYP